MSEKDNIDTSPKIGSHVTEQGTFYSFRPASNPGEFDTQAYYRTLGIAGRLKESSVLSADSRYSRWRETLYGIRQYFQNRLYTVFPEKEASILSAMLLGEKGELDREVKELYKRNGIIHILSISGVKTLKLDIPLVPETRINWAFMPLHIVIIYILKLCLDEEIIPRCRFPCSRGYFKKCIN